MITKKKPEEIQLLARSGKILAGVVYEVAKNAKPGKDVLELDKLAESLILKSGAKPSFKGFEGYPNATCISINHGVVHGIPRAGRKLKNGDIVGIDIGVEYQDFFTDMAVTVPVGEVPPEAKKLIKVTEQALYEGIKNARPGSRIGDIGYAIQTFVEKYNFSVVRSLVGHGVGYEVHEEPRVPNFGDKHQGIILEEGMVLALEPMVNIGGPEVITETDGWTVITVDHSLSAHFEHTIAITKNGPKILTK
ncbi:MAG: type I methionyl aminopeptidase [Patescibacteria group bacterium]|jgi:methionyl aminopeptidase